MENSWKKARSNTNKKDLLLYTSKLLSLRSVNKMIRKKTGALSISQQNIFRTNKKSHKTIYDIMVTLIAKIGYNHMS